MANTVDTRIVQMEFDNAQFERGAKQTLKTLENLDDALAFKTVGDGVKNLSSAMNRLDFTHITTSIESIGKSFTAMEAISFGVFERIGNKVGDLGMKIADELLVAQKRAGFGEYELELGSVQTIQASTGKDFKEIYGYLGQLNKYADQTIYSFKDMTANIGKFTNAGVDLAVAVKDIQGISNEAALSGANAQEASRAMYNFSQALSSGVVRLVDWKSIENANMATVEFKQALLDTALELGTVTKQGEDYISTTTDMNGKISGTFNATKGFNDALSSQWMTSEVLTKALAKYSDETTDLGKRAYAAAQDVKSFSQMMDTLKEAAGSGWSETFRLIFGEFEDAKKLWTGVSNTLGGVVDAFSNLRNHALRYWKQEGGRTKLLNSLIRLWKIFKERIEIIGQTFEETFPAINKTGHILMNLTKRFQRFTKQLKKDMLGNQEQLGAFKNRWSAFFKDVSTIISEVKKLFSTLFPVLSWGLTIAADAIDRVAGSTTLIQALIIPILEEVNTLATAFADMFWNFDSGEPLFVIFVNTLKTVFSVMNFGKKIVISIIKFITKNVDAVYWLADSFRSLGAIVGKVVSDIIKAFIDVFELDEKSWFADITENLAMFLRKVAQWVESSDSIVKIFRVIFKVIQAVITVVKALARGLSQALNPFDSAGTEKPLYSFLDGLVLLIDKFIEFITESQIIERSMVGVGKAFKLFGQFIDGLTGNSAFKGILNFFDNIGDTIKSGAIKRGFEDLIKTILTGIDKVWGAITGVDAGDGAAMGPLMTKFTDLQNGISNGDITAETFGERLRTDLVDAADAATGHIDKLRLFFESLSESIRNTRDDIIEIAGYLGGGLATAVTWVGKKAMTESDLKGLEESDNFIAKGWRWLNNVAELEEKNGDKTIGINNLLDQVSTLHEQFVALLPELLDVAKIVTTLETGKGVADMGRGILTFAKGIAGFGGSLKTLSLAIKQTGKIWAKAQRTLARATFLTSFAAFLLVILAGIVAITALIRTSENGGKDLAAAAAIMVGILGIMFAFVTIMIQQISKASKDNEQFVDALGGIAKVMLSFSACIILLAAAFALIAKTISSVPWYVTLTAFVILAAMFAAMGVVFQQFLDVMRGVAFQKATTDKTIGVLNGFAKILTSFAASILILVLAFGLLVKIISDNIDDPKTLGLATAILGGFIAALMGIVFLISNMKTKNYSSMVEASAKMFTSMGVALLALGVALGLIGGVVKEHADSPEQLFLAVGLIGLMLLVMAGFLAILTKMPANQTKNFDNASKFFASMALFVIGFAVSFGLMAEALRRAEENNVDPKFILGALGIMTALIAIIALIAGSGGMAAGGAMMIMAVGVVALAAGFFIFAKAMRELAEVDSDKIDSLIKAFGKNWLKLIAGGIGLTVFAAGATAMAIALIALSGALFLLGLALQPIMPLLTMLMDKFQQVGDTVDKSTDKLGGSAKGSLGASIGEKIGAGLRDLVKNLKKYAPEIIDDIVTIMSMVVRAFFIPLQAVGKGIIDFLVVSLNYINENIGQILEPLGAIITKVANFLKLYAPVLAETVALLIFYVFNGAFVVLAAYAGILAESLYNAIAALLEAFGDQLTGEKNARIAAAIARIVDGLFDLIKQTFQALSKTKMAETGANIIDAIVEGIKAAPNKLKKALNDALGIDIFDVGEDVDLSLHAGEIGWKVENGDWVYSEELARIQAEEEKAYQEAERLRRMSEDALAGGGGAKTTVNSPYDTKQMEQAQKDAAEFSKEATKNITDGAQEAIDESKPDIGSSIGDFFTSMTADNISKIDTGALKDKVGGIFGDITNIVPSSDDLTAGFTNSFSGMPDMSTMTENAGFDTNIICTPVIDGDNMQIMQDGQLSDFAGMEDLSTIGSGSYDISQQTNEQVNTQWNDETTDAYNKLKTAVDNLTEMLNGVVLVDENTKTVTNIAIDGKTIASATSPFFDTSMVKKAGKAAVGVATGKK